MARPVSANIWTGSDLDGCVPRRSGSMSPDTGGAAPGKERRPGMTHTTTWGSALKLGIGFGAGWFLAWQLDAAVGAFFWAQHLQGAF